MAQVSTKTLNSFDRRHFIGGSGARIIMEKALIRLWQEKRGEVGPEDLSGDLIVQLSLATEDLNRAWYEGNTGHAITDEPGQRPLMPWSPRFRGFFWVGLRSLTPGPPPFSSMNSTPAFSRTRLMFESVSGSPA
jgi:hypothetical protein